MESQSELFEDLPRAANPRANFESFRIGQKIVQVPFSFWKDGRKRFDLTELGGRIITSRNPEIADQQAIDELRQIFQSRDEIIQEHDERAIEVARRLITRGRERLRKPRVKKRALGLQSKAPIYANPFIEDKSQLFGKYPDWLLARKDLNDHEKMVYGRLLFPLPPICKSWDKNLGVIIGLNQGELGKALGKSRTWANQWLLSLQDKKWIECIGPQGAKQITKFLWKEWMPETCQTVRHVSAGAHVGRGDSSSHTVQQQSVTRSDNSCQTVQQVSQGLEKREARREERKEISLRSASPKKTLKSYDGPGW